MPRFDEQLGLGQLSFFYSALPPFIGGNGPQAPTRPIDPRGRRLVSSRGSASPWGEFSNFGHQPDQSSQACLWNAVTTEALSFFMKGPWAVGITIVLRYAKPAFEVCLFF